MLSKYNFGYIIYVVNLSQPCFFLKAFRTCRAKGSLGLAELPAAVDLHCSSVI